MDQIVEDAISKATAQARQSNSNVPVMFSNQFNPPQYSMASQPYHIPHGNPSAISAQPIHLLTPQLQPPTYSSAHNQTPSVDPRGNLPQDILHILDSDFTSESADHQAAKDQQISRVAEELRVKVRLSRYRRVRDQLSDSEDDNTEQEEEESDSSEDGPEDDSQQIQDDQKKYPQVDTQSDDEADLVDGSGDEEGERAKNNKTLAKLRMEIESIIGVPEALSAEVSHTAMKSDGEEEESTTGNESGHQKEIEPIAEDTHDDPLTVISDEPGETTTEDKILDESVTTNELLAKVKSQIDQLRNGSELSVTTSKSLLEACAIEESTSLSTSIAEPAPQESSSFVKPQGTKPEKKKPPPKKRVAEPTESGDESDDGGPELNASTAGPTTANELKEPPPEVVEVPFDRVADEELRLISPFGSIASLVGNVLVIQGTAGLGFDRVLDEGTLVCKKDGLVIGKIFETFGSVTSPHYSVRLPKHILACADQKNEAGLDLSPGLVLYYLPTHSNFVFTAQLRAQPKGTDASNFFDEEANHADEIEFSDDEAEAAYRKACKLAKKSARDGNSHPQNHSRDHNNSNQQPRNSVQVPEDGRRMFIKMPSDSLNYGGDDSDMQALNAPVESDYSVLERPKNLIVHQDHSTSINSTNKQSPAQRARGKKRANTGRNRNQKKPPQQTRPPSSQPVTAPLANSTGTSSNHPAANPRNNFQSNTTSFTNPSLSLSLPPHPNSHQMQAQPTVQGSSMMMPGNVNMNYPGMPNSNSHHLQGMHSSSAPHMPLWNGTNAATMAQNSMMMAMMMNHNNQNQINTGIPSYNPLLPSTTHTPGAVPSSSPSNPTFQFGLQNFYPNSNVPLHFTLNPSTHQSPSSEQLSASQYNPQSTPSFQVHQHNLHHQQTQSQDQHSQHNQSSSSPHDINSNQGGHYNPWFYRPT
ncbi:hypothetical protein PSTG_08401 [Puccinia striiformis f. sp. tritici PST-78]|uniref:H/ACA ribonucleoprotein complex non-core subunit NAF1 n=1 Tax=Puccinia striiformis f. sp. tritici PST-78 TaxID=1165861 RepID=A0A0L0VGA0_9BASI|nr:hypothetical protein PSTG_08401 [Puccinia striiformis f. sp. tritici PST-78]